MTGNFSKQSAYRLQSLLTLLLLLLLTSLLAWLSTRYPLQYDWTRSGRHSLSAASIIAVERLEDAVEVTAYAREQPALRGAIEDFIARYQRVKPDLTLRFVNPDGTPDEVRRLGISINGEMLLQYRERNEHLRELDEGAFTNALIRLSRSADRWIGYIEGHGERDLLGEANHDLGEWGRHLGNRGYRIRPLNLTQVPAIPDNTAVLVVAGPQIALLPGESSVLVNYLERGGNLLWLLDPDDGTLPGDLAAYLGVTVPGGTVIDVAGKYLGIDDPSITIVTSSLYGDHPAINNFSYTTLFPRAAALQSGDDGNWSATPLLTTGNHTWLETGQLDGEITLDEGVDTAGPLVIGLGLERRTDRPGEADNLLQRVVVVGDGDFISNTYLGNSGNLDLGVRLIDWLSSDDRMIDVPVRTVTDTHLDVSDTTVGAAGILLLFILPMAFSITGMLVWWRRRRT